MVERWIDAKKYVYTDFLIDGKQWQLDQSEIFKICFVSGFSSCKFLSLCQHFSKNTSTLSKYLLCCQFWSSIWILQRNGAKFGIELVSVQAFSDSENF